MGEIIPPCLTLLLRGKCGEIELISNSHLLVCIHDKQQLSDK